MTDSRHALIIANDRYTDQGLKKLKAPAQDAAALERVLHDPQIGDFEVEIVHNASADLMRRRIQGFFNDRRRADTLLLHFSCHGLKSESGELYFAASDTEPPLLAATAVASQFVRGCMSGTRAGRSVLISPVDNKVPHTITSAQPTIHGVMVSPRNSVPYSTANTGVMKVTASARLGPACSIRRKYRM